jgi:putative oxidoreductase
MDDWAFLIGRILLAIVFLLSAVRYHFGGAGMRYAESYRAPFPKLLVPFSGLVIAVAALLLGLGVWANVAALVLIAFLLVVSYFMHPFWKEPDPETRLGQQVHFAKNLGLVGGLLVVFAYYEDKSSLSLTDPL